MRYLVKQYKDTKAVAQMLRISQRTLREIAAEALKEVYFQDNGRRAGQLEEVRFTDIEHLEFDL
ncbi:hypothetical protein RKD18_007905 [Streptomyces phaeoluteigriseus]